MTCPHPWQIRFHGRKEVVGCCCWISWIFLLEQHSVHARNAKAVYGERPDIPGVDTKDQQRAMICQYRKQRMHAGMYGAMQDLAQSRRMHLRRCTSGGPRWKAKAKLSGYGCSWDAAGCCRVRWCCSCQDLNGSIAKLDPAGSLSWWFQDQGGGCVPTVGGLIVNFSSLYMSPSWFLFIYTCMIDRCPRRTSIAGPRYRSRRLGARQDMFAVCCRWHSGMELVAGMDRALCRPAIGRHGACLCLPLAAPVPPWFLLPALLCVALLSSCGKS